MKEERIMQTRFSLAIVAGTMTAILRRSEAMAPSGPGGGARRGPGGGGPGGGPGGGGPPPGGGGSHGGQGGPGGGGPGAGGPGGGGPGGGGPGGGGPGGRRPPLPGFAFLDSDGDGRVSKAEFTA